MKPGRGLEIARAFLRLGCLSFGGPVAHLGYFREEFVRRRAWLDDAAYSDLVALCQFLPGPASSQVVFALGLRRAGLTGALLASLCFTAPSAALMIVFAYSIPLIGDLQKAGWLHGLKLAAVAVVAQAVWGMGRKLCPDRTRLTMAWLGAILMLVLPFTGAQLAVIALGAFAGYWLCRPETAAGPDLIAPETPAPIRRPALIALGCFFLLLLALPLIAATGSPLARQFDSFYRAGALVFGGGHVVLPLLRAEVVAPGWISDGQFLAGYGAAQAVPGPLFTFAAYLGAVLNPGPHAWLGGLWCLLAIFLPAWLLVAGCLPFWELLRRQPWAQASLAGANAAVVGVLLAALYHPVWTQSVASAADVLIVLIAFALLQTGKVSPVVVVLLCAALGQWWR